jgi:hypothetical protein
MTALRIETDLLASSRNLWPPILQVGRCVSANPLARGYGSLCEDVYRQGIPWSTWRRPARRYPPEMDFEVITDAGGNYDNYTGDADYQLLDSGALHVWPRDDRRSKEIIYSVHGWVRVEILTERQ